VGTGLAGTGSGSAGAVQTGLVVEAGAGSTGTGLMGTLPGVRLTGTGLCCGVLSTTGLRPMASSTSAAQSDRAGSCGLALAAPRAVGDGAGFCTSPWVVPIPSCSPVSTPCHPTSRSLISFRFFPPFSSSFNISTLSTSGSSLVLPCCLTAVFIAPMLEGLESVEAFVVSASSWAGIGVGMAMTQHMSATRSGRSGVVVVL
jgi:hypothetical protein